MCKYIDGPRLLAERLDERAKQLDLDSGYSSKQRDGGYYAYHFYVKIPMELNTVEPSDMTFSSTWVDLKVEIQLTTQLQEVLYDITHRFYQHSRDKRSEDPDAWKWDVTSSRFRAGYMGHTLHLLEAIIAELRDNGLMHRDATSSDNSNV